MADNINMTPDTSRKRKIDSNAEDENSSDSFSKAAKAEDGDEGTASNNNIHVMDGDVKEQSTNVFVPPVAEQLTIATMIDGCTPKTQDGGSPQETTNVVVVEPSNTTDIRTNSRDQQDATTIGQVDGMTQFPEVPVSVSQPDHRIDPTPSQTIAVLSADVVPTTTTTAPSADVHLEPTFQSQTMHPLNENDIHEEKAEVPALYVGRVIGRGGEMIRDLQARSGCRLDVDQNVPIGAPRVISYRGTRNTIDFAKQMVQILCTENGKGTDLPLGHATRKVLVVPADVIGKIIGRGGETIRELQSVSQGKIQVDHSGAGGIDPNMRQVTLVGTELSVVKAEEMVRFLVSNPGMDAMTGISMLIREKSSGVAWGSGPPYMTMPNNGQGMQDIGGGNGGNDSTYGVDTTYGQQPNPKQYVGQYSREYGVSTESDIYLCDKMYMGRVIGQKGVTINDIQRRCGCNILINQDVPQGHDCQITIKGPREGIDSAKQMLTDIIQMGPNHPYAGGGAYSPDLYGKHRQAQSQPMQQSHQHQMSHDYASSGYGQQPAYGQVYGHWQHGQQYTQQPFVGYSHHPISGLSGVTTQPQSTWKAAIAPNGQTYYYNASGETSWQRPPDM